MNKQLLYCVAILAYPTLLMANENKQITIGYEHRDFSQGRGSSNIGHIEFKNKFTNGAVVADIAGGERDFGKHQQFDGVKGKVDVYYTWNNYLSTRTGITLSNNNPAFVDEEYLQEFTVKVLDNVTMLAGAKYAKYHDNTELKAYSAGVSVYTKRLVYSYKYTDYNSSKTKNGYGNLASVKLKDQTGSGSTQLWVSQGKNAHLYDWLPDASVKKDSKGVSIRRVQPITDSVSVAVSIGKNWYKTPDYKYHNTEGKLDVIYTW